MSKRVAIYARVSTDGQTTENQVIALEEVASRMGWQVTGRFIDSGISGAKGRDQRPAYDELLRAMTRREFDMVMAWSVDRLGRSLQDLVAFLCELRDLKTDVYLHQQGIDTSTAAGRAMFQMLGVFAEFEHAMIRERVMAGLARAKAEGKTLGRPRTAAKTEAAIRKALAAGGKGIRKLAREHKVGTSVVQRLAAEG
jgi:DNA invertase Pin-like site-specific DNA recombinase